MHVAVDLDDVVLEFVKSLFASVELEFGHKAEFDGNPWGDDAVALRENALWKTVGHDDWWGWLRERDWLWATFPAVPGAIGGVKRLRTDGHYVECVTSKPDWAEFAVWKWLGRWRPPFNRVTIVGVGESKLDHTDADVIIDDKVETAEGFAVERRGGVLFDRAHAYDYDEALPTLHVARHWHDVIWHINLMEAS